MMGVLKPAMDWPGIASSCAPLSTPSRTIITAVWVPLRHVWWAASLNAANLTQSVPRRTASARSVELSALHLRKAVFFSALGWALGDAGALRAARRRWLEDAAWQGLRRYAEDALALRDRRESAAALTLALEGLLGPLLGAAALRRCAGDEAGALAEHFETLFETPNREPVRTDTAAATRWASRAASAVLPVIERVWEQDTDDKLAVAMETLSTCASNSRAVGRMTA